MFAMEDLKLFNEAGIPKVKCAAARLKTGNSHGARPILNLHQKSKYKWCICLKIIFKKKKYKNQIGSNVWNFSTEQ